MIIKNELITGKLTLIKHDRCAVFTRLQYMMGKLTLLDDERSIYSFIY